MAGADSYKEFDSSSIVTTNTADSTVRLGRYRIRTRELVLGLVAIIALVLVIILAIVLAVEVGDKGSGKGGNVQSSVAQSMEAQSTAAPSSQQGLPHTVAPDDPDRELCVTPACLKAAHHMKSSMDEKFDPCQDFYSYACGSYDDVNPQSYLLSDVTPFNQIALDNSDKLIDAIFAPVNKGHEHSYERKLKHFMSSCTDHFDKEDLRGLPLVHHVLNKWGNISFLTPGYDPSIFDLHTQLVKTYVDFWTTPFFKTHVVRNQEDWNKRIVELNFGGLGMEYQFYVDDQVKSSAIRIYSNYMRLIASLVTIDAGVEPDSEAIETFIADVVSVESILAYTVYMSPRLSQPHQVDKLMTLDEITAHTNNSIDFVDLMKAIFYEYPAMFNGQTTVAVSREGYFKEMGSYVKTLVETDEGKRKLSNYLVWNLLDRYAPHLSWSYVHAKRRLNYFLYGAKDDSSGYRSCFTVATARMRTALNAVFIKDVLKKENKNEAETVLKYVREEMLKDIKAAIWMGQADRDTAFKKINESLYKIGYPANLVDDDYVDNHYYAAAISESDYFGNILSLNKMQQADFNRLIGSYSSSTTWAYDVFYPMVEYYNPWHEFIATASIFQEPVFSHEGPSYYNFGGVGSLMAKHLIHAVDEYGNSFRLDGSHFGEWWAEATVNKYREIRKCAVDVQSAFSLGTFYDPDYDLTITPNITFYAQFYAPELLSDSSGLRMAYKAYKTWEGRAGTEKMPPGFSKLNTDKMFFLAFAQTYCQNSPDLVKEDQLYGNRYPSKAKVNLALSQTPEFSQTFNCRAGQPMHAQKTCSLF